MQSVSELVSRLRSYQPAADVGLVEHAWHFAEAAHGPQLRKSGDPYFVHPARVAGIITDLRLDVASVCAALLHDVVEDTAVSQEALEAEFGTEIAFLVDGVTKLSKINFLSKQDRQAESFRKMIVAMARDIRVLVVKLCDRLDNMRTLEFMSPEGQERTARETMDIYAPLANRLGIARFKNEFQDLSFRWLAPDAHGELAERVAESEPQRQSHIEQVCRQLTQKLAQQGFAAEVQGRPKHLYSIHRKMQDRQCPFEQVYDIVAFRVVVESVAECYAALGVIHSMWTPVPGRFKDYIALPKPNMYQSLHTTVFGPGHQRIEVQIRTHEMHRVAEHGIAAVWKYKEGSSGGLDPKDAARFGWLRQLMEQTELKDPAEFLESVKVDLFQDEVYVFTPKGDVRAFPRGATPVDFAYSIHTEVGGRCAGARVNGSVVPLGYKLRNGDLVEVLPSPDQQPQKDWLDFVVTSRARAKIRAHLRTVQRERSLKLGRELLERDMQRGRMSLARLEKSTAENALVRQRFNVSRIEDLYVEIGYGKVDPKHVVDFLAPESETDRKSIPPSAIKEGRFEALVRRVTGKSSHGILLKGVDDVLVRYTKCCNPLPGDEIVGFMSRGRGITVHRRTCPKAFEADPSRRVDISWDPKAKINRAVKVTVMTANRPGILATVGQTFHAQGINISEATCRAGDDGRATNTFTFQCSDLAQLRGVIRQLERVDGVMGVERA
ncbi:MAG: bifunctional (p)ppGpp synthetase/guanosine-3',5'-bis(diphosphate) 3'-pyrophosphohydrolase [Myxococcales bacterium]|nr:bifunctional (p)ppGpp synthetase/guanosine-3',5'-bis(diphosphate) 3'-pyrophosphohydrolase [Myxococcales bacterium]